MEIGFFDQFILGLIQGIFEWLPISSSGFLALFANNFLGISNLESLVELALFFHLGTFLAAVVYFRKEVKELFLTLFKYKKSKVESKKLFNFVFVSFIITSILGILILKLIGLVSVGITGKMINLIIAVLLLVTAIVGFSSKIKGLKKEKDLNLFDGILLGIVQGIAVLPGVSRSGTTTSTLLLKKFDETTALRLSFLMSLPVVLCGNIILNLKDFSFGNFPFVGLVTSFIFGLLTITGLIKLSKKINFNWFVLIFGLLIIFSVIFI